MPDDHQDLYMSEPCANVLDTYHSWLEQTSPCLITTRGGRGFGKSLNARALVRELKTAPKLVAHFTFSEIDAHRSSLESFLASVIFQILNVDSARFSRVQDLFASVTALKIWTEASLLVIFQFLLDTKIGIGPLHLIIDDFQNCDHVWSLVGMLEAAMSNGNSPTKLKVALFYNQQGDKGDVIEDALRRFDGYRMHVPTWTLSLLKPMVSSIVGQVIGNNPYLADSRSQLCEALKKCSSVTEVVLAVQSLDTNSGNSNSSIIPRSLESLIRNIPPNIPDVVTSKFNNLTDQGRVTLGWILHSRRPLKLNELATAVALTDNKANFSSTFDPRNLPVDLSADLRSLFGPLVRLEGGGIVFSDGAVRDQFIGLITEEQLGIAGGRPSNSAIPGNADITRILVGYLSWQEFAIPVKKALQAKTAEFILPPGKLFDLLAYAVRFLPSHFGACNRGGLESFPQTHRLIQMWSSLNVAINTTCLQHLCVADLALLAAQLGLTVILESLEKDIVGTYRDTAVSLASWGGHFDTVRWLLTGSGVGPTEYVATSDALECAAVRGYDDIVDYLLTYMEEMEETESERLLLLMDRLLCKAAELGYEKQVPRWITLGANVNAAPENITPLQYASRNGHTSIVRYLLSIKGVDVNSNSGYKIDRPIILAAMKGYETVVQDLLAAGADVTCTTRGRDTQCTPLYLAAEHGDEAVVRCLLDAETPGHSMINQQNFGGNSPLIIASMKGHDKIVKLLLDANASVTLCNKTGLNAIYYIIRSGREDLAMEVLTHTKSMEDSERINLFHQAAKRGFERIVKYIWESMAEDKKARLMVPYGRDAETALHLASMHGHIAVVNFLLQSGGNVDATSEFRYTPLEYAVLAGEVEIVKLLLAHNANAVREVTDPRCARIRSLLHEIAMTSVDPPNAGVVVGILLEMTSIDPNGIDEMGDTALS